MKFTQIVMVFCLILLVQACSKKESENSTALAGRVGSGVLPYEGAQPAQLFWGRRRVMQLRSVYTQWWCGIWNWHVIPIAAM